MPSPLLLRLAAVAGGVVCLVGAASPASAHPVLSGADPAPGSIQQRAPSSLTLRFAGLIEPGRSSVTLAASRGGAGEGKATRLPLASSSGHLLQAQLPALPVGTYGVAYSVTGSDGHVATGVFHFAYWPSGAAAPEGITDLARRSTRFNAASSPVRAVALTASLPLAGLILVGAVFARGGRRTPRWLTAAVGGLSLLVTASDLVVLELSGGLAQITQSRYGFLIGVHAAIGLALFLLTRPVPARSRQRGTVAGVGLLVPLALTSHEFALSSHPLLAAGVDFVHLLAAAFWVGGLCWLLLRLADRDAGSLVAEARRFSALAVAATLVVVASGSFNAWSRVPSRALLFGSGYGRVLLLKILLVVGVLGAAAANRRRARQRMLRPGSGRTLVGEGLNMAAVLAMAGVLVSMTPPARLLPAPAMPLLQSVVLGDRAYSVLVVPGRAGQNTVDIRPIDAGAGGPGRPPQTQVVAAGRAPRTVALQSTASGWTGSLELPRSTATLRLFGGGTLQELGVIPSSSGTPLRLRSTAALAGPNGEECRAGVVGEMVAVAAHNQAGGRTASLIVTGAGGAAGPGGGSGAPSEGLGCGPSQASLPDPRTAGRVFSRFLLPYQARKVALVTDGGARAAAFAEGFSQRGGIPATAFPADRLADARAWAPDAVVVTGGPAAAAAVVDATADGAWIPSRGVFLAPWLLDANLLETTIAHHGPQFSIGLAFDPFGQEAQRYLSALARFAPFESPSAAGLAGYLEATRALSAPGAGPRTTGPVTQNGGPASEQFFAAVQVSFLPAQFEHGESPHLWLGAGGLATISGVVRDPGPR